MSGTDSEPTAWVRHGRSDLALQCLREGEGRALLLLHGLGERTPTVAPDWVAPWPGPVWGLDFTGHGRSTLPRGGGYTAEMLLGDADAASSTSARPPWSDVVWAGTSASCSPAPVPHGYTA